MKLFNIMIYTNLLYFKDDIIHSIITTFIQHNDFERFVFYVKELYDTKMYDDLLILVYKLYYYFIYVTNKKFETTINKMLKKWEKSKDWIVIYDIYQKLWMEQQTNHVFMVDYFKNNYNEVKIKIYRKYNFATKNVNIEYIPLLISIEKKRWENISYYLNYLERKNLVDKNLFTLFEKEHNIKIKSNKYLQNSLIIVAELVKKLITKPIIIHEKSKSPNIPEFILKKNDTNISNYKYLKNKRLFAIDYENIGIYNNENILPEDVQSNWTKYCKQSPIWEERIKKHNGSWNDDKLHFDTEENEEEFYNNFEYDIDEQPFEITSKAFMEINNINFKSFYEKIISDEKFNQCLEIIS